MLAGLDGERVNGRQGRRQESIWRPDWVRKAWKYKTGRKGKRKGGIWRSRESSGRWVPVLGRQLRRESGKETERGEEI